MDRQARLGFADHVIALLFAFLLSAILCISSHASLIPYWNHNLFLPV